MECLCAILDEDNQEIVDIIFDSQDFVPAIILVGGATPVWSMPNRGASEL
jgi:hypothetical protein